MTHSPMWNYGLRCPFTRIKHKAQELYFNQRFSLCYLDAKATERLTRARGAARLSVMVGDDATEAAR